MLANEKIRREKIHVQHTPVKTPPGHVDTASRVDGAIDGYVYFSSHIKTPAAENFSHQGLLDNSTVQICLSWLSHK
jgi:hypothetical protein